MFELDGKKKKLPVFSCGCACLGELGLTYVTLRGLRQGPCLASGVSGVGISVDSQLGKTSGGGEGLWGC